MSDSVGFSVLYRFKVHPGREEDFRKGWRQMTDAIRDTRGGLGSRLHLTDDGTFVAYAQWPDKDTWERSQELGPAHGEAARLMAESVKERLPPILLHPEIDLLEMLPIKPAVSPA